MVTIKSAQLAGIDPQDPARLTLGSNMGMRENKTIEAIVEVTDMPIESYCPKDLAPLIHGRAAASWPGNGTRPAKTFSARAR